MHKTVHDLKLPPPPPLIAPNCLLFNFIFYQGFPPCCTLCQPLPNLAYSLVLLSTPAATIITVAASKALLSIKQSPASSVCQPPPPTHRRVYLPPGFACQALPNSACGLVLFLTTTPSPPPTPPSSLSLYLKPLY